VGKVKGKTGTPILWVQAEKGKPVNEANRWLKNLSRNYEHVRLINMLLNAYNMLVLC
jgi:hypothetical protein